MADNSEVIKEFLVAVGFKLDEGSIKKFSSIMGETGKKVGAFATTLVAAGAAVETFVTKVSEKFEGLYWASQRLGSSTAQIQDYALGIRNLGGTAEGARESLESLAKNLRTNPGFRSMVGMLGANPNNSTTEIMQSLGQRFKGMPYFIAQQYASRLGIDERTLWAMVHSKGRVAGETKNQPYASLYAAAGLNADKAAKNAKDFMQQIRLLGAQYTVLAQVLETRLLPVAKEILSWSQSFVKSINEQMKDGSQLSQVFSHLKPVAKDIGSAAKGMAKIAKQAAELLKFLPKEAYEFGLIGWVLFGKKAALLLSAVGTISHFVDNILGDKNEVNEKKEQDYGTKSKYSVSRWLFNHGLGYLNTNEFNTTYGSYKAKQEAGEGLKKEMPGQKALLALVRKLEGSGDKAVSPAGAIGRYQIMPETAKQYGFDPSRLKDPDYNTKVAKAILADLVKKFGNLRDVLIAYNAGPGRVQTFNRTGWLPTETKKYLERASKSVVIHQKNETTINGEKNPRETAAIVMDNQSNINSALVRDMKGAVD